MQTGWFDNDYFLKQNCLEDFTFLKSMHHMQEAHHETLDIEESGDRNFYHQFQLNFVEL